MKLNATTVFTTTQAHGHSPEGLFLCSRGHDLSEPSSYVRGKKRGTRRCLACVSITAPGSPLAKRAAELAKQKAARARRKARRVAEKPDTSTVGRDFLEIVEIAQAVGPEKGEASEILRLAREHNIKLRRLCDDIALVLDLLRERNESAHGS